MKKGKLNMEPAEILPEVSLLKQVDLQELGREFASALNRIAHASGAPSYSVEVCKIELNKEMDVTDDCVGSLSLKISTFGHLCSVSTRPR
jgi:hypothetical protein